MSVLKGERLQPLKQFIRESRDDEVFVYRDQFCCCQKWISWVEEFPGYASVECVRKESSEMPLESLISDMTYQLPLQMPCNFCEKSSQHLFQPL